MKQKIVWVHQVVSRNFVSDFGASLKNIIGGRIGTYERMFQKALTETTDEFMKKYPNAKNISMRFEQFGQASVFIIVYGVVNG